jgi:hypothetical protein
MFAKNMVQSLNPKNRFILGVDDFGFIMGFTRSGDDYSKTMRNEQPGE